MNSQSVKKIFYVVTVIVAIIVNLFSSLNIAVKVVFTILEIILNIYLVNVQIDKISGEIKKSRLKNLEYLGMPPKIELFIQCTIFALMYLCVVFLFSGWDILKIKIGSIGGIVLISFCILLYLYSLTGQFAAVDKIGDKTEYIISNKDIRSVRGPLNILGRRVGKYENGIVISSYIFKNDEIINMYSKDKDKLTIYLTNKRKITIEDKKCKEFLLKAIS